MTGVHVSVANMKCGPSVFSVDRYMHSFCEWLKMPCKQIQNIPLSITNMMQHYTIFFISVNALRVSGGFSASVGELALTVPIHPH
jgi:hypothetical protein